MPSQLVTAVRALLTERADAGVPLTALERTFLLSALAPRTGASDDVVGQLEAAIVYARRVLLTDPPAGTDPAVVDQRRREATLRLIGAARAAIDYDPFAQRTTTPELPPDPRPKRADVDG